MILRIFISIYILCITFSSLTLASQTATIGVTATVNNDILQTPLGAHLDELSRTDEWHIIRCCRFMNSPEWTELPSSCVNTGEYWETFVVPEVCVVIP